MAIKRYNKNPIIKPEDLKPSRPDFEVVCVLNAGVAEMKGKVVLLLRVAERPVNVDPSKCLSPVYDVASGSVVIKDFDRCDSRFDFSDSRVVKTPEGIYLTSISHLRAAVSADGINFEITDTPILFPENIYEALGIEDPRISLIDGVYYISYVAVSPVGITTCLASTADFVHVKRHGAIFHPDNKDVEIFPGRINGKYYALHRPNNGFYKRSEIWIAESPDLICWGNHRYLMGPREGYWDNGRVGGGAVPFRVKEGWLEIYHGATKEDRYCLGAVLLDADEPWRILARSEMPILEPEADYETNGFFGNVVFSCGLLVKDNIIKLYYGAADTCIAHAEISIEDVLMNLNCARI